MTPSLTSSTLLLMVCVIPPSSLVEAHFSLTASLARWNRPTRSLYFSPIFSKFASSRNRTPLFHLSPAASVVRLLAPTRGGSKPDRTGSTEATKWTSWRPPMRPSRPSALIDTPNGFARLQRPFNKKQMVRNREQFWTHISFRFFENGGFFPIAYFFLSKQRFCKYQLIL